MRVAFYGNICNILYQIAKAVRAHSDIDAHVFLNINDHLQQLPESDDPELLEAMPDWIHRGDYQHRGWFMAPWKSSLVPLLKDFDLIVTGDTGPMIAQFAGKPMAFMAMGGDLTAYPFPLRFLYLYASMKDRAGVVLKGLWQRRALRRMTEIWSPPFQPCMDALRSLRIDERRISPQYFPVAIDARKIAWRAAPRPVPSELQFPSNAPKPLLIFHPTRIQIDDYSAKGGQGQSKGNLVLLEGFAQFIRNSTSKNTRLVLIDREVYGDNPKAKRWIAQAGIENHVIWLKPSRPTGFTRNELVDIYSLCDVVADQFGDSGGFGCIALEACACARPVVTRIDETIASRLYPWHPLLNAATPAEIAAQFEDLQRHPETLAEKGAQGRRWIEQFHSHEVAGPLYAARLHQVADTASQ